MLAGRKCREAGKKATGRFARHAHREFRNVVEELDGVLSEAAEAISETVAGTFEYWRGGHLERL